ncbi:MAG: hypothetical protein MI892_14540, partial [Desulfobacterales bacterium]|nr:hypothetical protein [Desulfobacterales bacterium]
PEEEQKNYSLHLKNLRNDASRILTLKVDAEDRVKKERDKEIARGMIKDGWPIDSIIKYIGLTKNEIDNL